MIDDPSILTSIPRPQGLVVKPQNEFLKHNWSNQTNDSGWLSPHRSLLTTNVTRDCIALDLDSILLEGFVRTSLGGGGPWPLKWAYCQ